MACGECKCCWSHGRPRAARDAEQLLALLALEPVETDVRQHDEPPVEHVCEQRLLLVEPAREQDAQGAGHFALFREGFPSFVSHVATTHKLNVLEENSFLPETMSFCLLMFSLGALAWDL